MGLGQRHRRRQGDRFEQKVTRTLKGSDVTRNGSTDDPALLIEQDDGTEVLKLHHVIPLGLRRIPLPPNDRIGAV